MTIIADQPTVVNRRPRVVQDELDRLQQISRFLNAESDRAFDKGNRSLGRALCIAHQRVKARFVRLAEKYPR